MPDDDTQLSQVKIETSAQDDIKPFFTRHWPLILQLLHLIAWNQIGVILRVQLVALFGGACDDVGSQSWQPCVTSPGLSRLGGAMFTNVPPNVLGSFAIGLFSSSASLTKAYPSFQPLHVVNLAFLPSSSPLQHHTALHLGLRTGLCGSLTTFASWILQMVKMMVGGRSTIGTEWVAALWGIYLNVALSLTSLVIGQHLAIFLSKQYQDKYEATDSESKKESNHGKVAPTQSWHGIIDLMVLVTLLTLTGVSLAYAIADGSSIQSPYSPRDMWFSILLGPAGCIARWMLAINLNTGPSSSHFFWGTWTANISACVIDFICSSVLARVSLTSLQVSLLNSIITGISGSLSTVSTWVTELQTLGLKPGSSSYIYGLGSVIPAIVLGIIIYGTSIWTL